MLSSYFCLFVLTRSWVEESPTNHNGVGGKITNKTITKTSCTVQGEEGNKLSLFPLYNYFIPKSQENGQTKILNNAIDLRCL